MNTHTLTHAYGPCERCTIPHTHCRTCGDNSLGHNRADCMLIAAEGRRIVPEWVRRAQTSCPLPDYHAATFDCGGMPANHRRLTAKDFTGAVAS